MRNLAHHLDEHTVVDFLTKSVPIGDVQSVAIHLVTCRSCREMVETCRDLGDLATGPPARERQSAPQSAPHSD